MQNNLKPKIYGLETQEWFIDQQNAEQDAEPVQGLSFPPAGKYRPIAFIQWNRRSQRASKQSEIIHEMWKESQLKLETRFVVYGLEHHDWFLEMMRRSDLPG